MYQFLHIGRAGDLSDGSDRRIYRLLEMLPGFLAWATIGLVILLSFFLPIWVAIFIIIFDVYWFIKTLYLSFHLRISYNKLRENLKINWLERLNNLQPSTYSVKALKSWQDIYHLIFLPLYKEDFYLVSASLESLMKTNYQKEKIIVALCWEERVGEKAEQVTKEIERIYGN